MRKHFLERANERKVAGIFALLNELIFCALNEIQMGSSLNCVHSESLARVATFRLDAQNCEGGLDVREDNRLRGLVDAHSAHHVASKANLTAKKGAMDSILALKDIETLEDQVMNLIAPGTLGIHLRGTDKRSEVIPPSMMSIRQSIDSFIRAHPVNHIFLSTDDFKYVKFMERYWPDLVVPRDYPMPKNNRKPLHLNLGSDAEVLQADQTAIKDAVALAHCDFFMYSASNLSHFALILGADCHREIQSLPSTQSKMRSLIYRAGNFSLHLRAGLISRLRRMLSF